MAEKGFGKETLRRYLFEEKWYIPKEAMTILSQLLFDEMNRYCRECEDDRMMCVLSPMCPERILLKVRINAGANKTDLPEFCYEQYKSNVKRFLEKRTTVYMPVDNILFNEDFFEIFFPRHHKKLIKAYKKGDIELLNLRIAESDLPGVKISFPIKELITFKRIINGDKLIKKGSFIYHITDDNRFMIIFFNGNLYVVDFKSGKTNCNATHDPIEDLVLLGSIIHLYGAINDLTVDFKRDENDDSLAHISISFPFEIPEGDDVSGEASDEGKAIESAGPEDDEPGFHDLIEMLQQYFFKISVDHVKEPESRIIIQLSYKNPYEVPKAGKYRHLSYKIINDIMKEIAILKNH